MERLVQEKRICDLKADGWHYPPIRKLRRQRPRRKRMAANKPKTEAIIAGEPGTPTVRIVPMHCTGWSQRN